jgi:hypothetical protein
MPTLNSITASPTTIPSGGASTVTVSVTPDPASADQSFHVKGVVVGTDQAADLLLTVSGHASAPVRFSLDPSTAQAGDVLLTCPDGGHLTPTATQGVYTFSV